MKYKSLYLSYLFVGKEFSLPLHGPQLSAYTFRGRNITFSNLFHRAEAIVYTYR